MGRQEVIKSTIRAQAAGRKLASLDLGTLTKLAHAVVAGASLPPVYYTSGSVRLEFEGEVVSKERPRTGLNGHVYTPAKTVKFEKEVAALAKAALDERGLLPFRCSIIAHLEIRMSIPSSWDATKRAMAPMLAVASKDLDNMEKAIFDGLNGVAYFDDVQITQKFSTKRYVDDYGKPPGFSLDLAPSGVTQADIITINKLVQQIKKATEK